MNVIETVVFTALFPIKAADITIQLPPYRRRPRLRHRTQAGRERNHIGLSAAEFICGFSYDYVTVYLLGISGLHAGGGGRGVPFITVLNASRIWDGLAT